MFKFHLGQANRTEILKLNMCHSLSISMAAPCVFLCRLYNHIFTISQCSHSQSLLEMGTKDLTFVQLNQLIGRKTGGISVYPFTSSIQGREDPCSHIIAQGKAMAGRVEDLFNLVSAAELFCHYIQLKWLSSTSVIVDIAVALFFLKASAHWEKLD